MSNNFNIGFAKIIKTETCENFEVFQNGLFDECIECFDFKNYLNTNSIIKLNEKERILFFKKIKIKETSNLYLVVLLQRYEFNDINVVLGSAICFKKYNIFAGEIIYNIYKNLKSLKPYFSKGTYDIKYNDLIMLDGFYKINKYFKGGKLKYDSNFNIKGYVKFYNIKRENKRKEIEKGYLELFCEDENLSHLEYLFISNNSFVNTKLLEKNIIPLDYSELLKPKGINFNFIFDEESDTKGINILGTSFKKSELYKVSKANKKHIVIFTLMSLIVIFLIYKLKTNSNVILPITESEKNIFYVKVDNYHANVREESKKTSKTKTKLFNGDEIQILEKNDTTNWVKIKYGENIGYISNELVTKTKPKGIEIINKKSYVKGENVILYDCPNVKSNKSEEIERLKNQDEIFIKTLDIKTNWYSVKVIKGSVIYNGFLKKENIERLN